MQLDQGIPSDPSLPPSADLADWYPAYYCDCALPVPQERAERKGAATTYCTRCERELPVRLGSW
jgi:hypothetical protein